MQAISRRRMSDRDRRERTGVREQRLDVAGQRLMGRVERTAGGDENQQDTLRPHARPATARDLAQAAAGAVALHGSPDALLAGDEPHAAHLARDAQRQQQAVTAAIGESLAANAREVAPAGQAMGPFEPLGGWFGHS